MPAHAADSTSYTVRDGDSLYGIAAKSGVELSALLDANDLTLASVILPGQHLSIPDIPSSSSSSDATYTVTWGDSLSKIAGSHQVSLSSLLSANDLTVSSLIMPGMRLRLPAGSTTAAATPTKTANAAPSAPSAASYTVTWGDSLSKIAGRHQVSLSSLMSANNLTASSLILPGMRLRLPAGSTTAAAPTRTPAATATRSYTVVWGDSLSKIAGRYQVNLSSLLTANDLTASSLILPGRRLQIPAGAFAPSPASPSTTTSSPESSGHERVDAVVRYATAQQGKPYAFFTKGPNSFDCSGLTLAAYAQADIKLVHYSAAQARQGTEVDLSSESIRPGDLVFLKRRGSATINHVGIAIDADTWIQATGYGDTVRIGSMPARNTIVAVRRFVNP